MKKYIFLFLFTFLGFSILESQTDTQYLDVDYVETAQSIKLKYEQNTMLLSPSKAGHMGLRLYRNYKDSKYKYLLLQGINYSSNSLDKLISNGLDSISLNEYARRINKSYKPSTVKKSLRKATLKKYPYYRIYAAKMLRSVARLDELGIEHNQHDDFMKALRSYDFRKVFEDSIMIKAWGAQLANQVYWLNQLEINDYRSEFRKAVKETYPHTMDSQLSDQQFENKIYTLTHIIIAASEYYRYKVSYDEYADIIEYFRSNKNQILNRCKEDVIIEVGLSLLLVNENYPEIIDIKNYIMGRVCPQNEVIPSVKGNSDLSLGEHRNIIAVLLLDWKGCSIMPSKNEVKTLKTHIPKSISIVDEE